MELILKGNRINLRKLRKADANSIYRNARDYEISRYTTLPYPYRLKHAIEFIGLTHKKIKKKTSFELGIELKETKEIIGMISLLNVDYKNKNAEIGYWLGKNYWGKKIMKEAVKLILGFGFKQLKLVRIYGKVLHPNERSAKLLERSGFKYEGRLRKADFRKGRWMDDLIYSILSTEFKSKR